MTRAQIITDWTTGPLGDNRPRVLSDYPPAGWSDVTGQPAANIPPFPNALVIEGVWDDAIFTVLETDPSYTDAILWSEPA